MDITSQICPVCGKHFVRYRPIYDLTRRPGRTLMPSPTDEKRWTVFNTVLEYIPLPCGETPSSFEKRDKRKISIEGAFLK